MKYFFSILLVFALAPSLAKAQFEGPFNCEIILKAQFKKAKIEICGKRLDVELAQTDAERTIGLMCRESLSKNSGMLFIFENERVLSFWMKNTKIPLSIGYLDKNKALIDTYDMQPMSEKSIESSKPAIYALETNLGWFTKNRIKPGCKFNFVTENSKPKVKK